MTMKKKRCATMLLLLCLAAVRCVVAGNDSAPCPTGLSIIIPSKEYQLLDNGGLLHQKQGSPDDEYPPGSHWLDGREEVRRGCVCHIAAMPCVRKCCPKGQILALNFSRESPCAGADDRVADLRLDSRRVAPEMQAELATRPQLQDWFTIVEDMSCEARHNLLDLMPEQFNEDAYTLRPDGRLEVTSQLGLLTTEKFCMDQRVGSDRLEVFICISSDEAKAEEEKHMDPFIIRAGHMLSLPFLAVTFIVYAIIPELRNIYGKTLMCYVISLLIGYTLVSADFFFTVGLSCAIIALFSNRKLNTQSSGQERESSPRRERKVRPISRGTDRACGVKGRSEVRRRNSCADNEPIAPPWVHGRSAGDARKSRVRTGSPSHWPQVRRELRGRQTRSNQCRAARCRVNVAFALACAMRVPGALLLLLLARLRRGSALSSGATSTLDVVTRAGDAHRQPGNTNPPSALGADKVVSTEQEDDGRLPMVQVCCEPGYFFVKTQCVSLGEPAGEVAFPVVWTLDIRPTNKTGDDFRKVVHYPCTAESYGLYPNYDVFFFLEDGNVYTVNMTRPPYITSSNFCLAVIPDEETGSQTVVAVCALPEEEIPLIFSICNFMSGFFLALTFIIYAVVPDLQNIHGFIVRAHVSAFALAYTTLAIVQFGDQYVITNSALCYVSAYIVHFSFLASFFWLNVMCFDIWWTFGGFRSLHGSVKQRERKKFIMYSIYAWGCASILTIICMIMDLVPGIPTYLVRPEFGKGSCWFESYLARALYFYLPMGLTVICNIVLFILTALKIVRHKKDTARQLKSSDSRRHDDNKQWFNLYLKLFIVMGINWSMEIVSWLFENQVPKYVWYLTDLTNTLQGVIIFIIFVWKDKIKRLLIKRFGCEGSNFLSRNSTSRSGCPTSTVSRTTCVTAAPLQEKVNPYADPYRGKTTVTDDSDCI